MKASDITDDQMRAAVEALGGGAPHYHWTMIWDVETALEFPRKIVLAKARRMINRGTLHGCACGCRADLHLPRGDAYCC